MRNFFLLTAVALICAGCAVPDEDYPAFADYILVPGNGVSLDTNHARYDAKLGGFWVAGNGTVLIEPRVENPKSGLVLSIRNRPEPATEPAVSLVRVVTPENIILARYRDKTITVMKSDDAASVSVLDGAGLLEMKRDGKRMIVKFSNEFFRRYAASGAAVTWFDETSK